MDPEKLPLNSVLYCPNSECIASGKHNRGIEGPLIEIPVDPNHVELSCPHCSLNLTQCDGCFGLIHSDVETINSTLIHTCRRCGFPNIIDENLRAVLSLPRTRPLPYHSVRIIQRAIHPEAYSRYKRLELSSIESLTSATSDEFEVISASSLASSSHASQPSRPSESPSQNHRTPSHLTNAKKRPRSDMLDGPQTTKNGAAIDLDDLSPQFGPPTKRPAQTDEHQHKEHLNRQEDPTYNQGTNQWTINLRRWKSKLRTPVSSMVPFLRAQLKVLGVSICIKQDLESWNAMQYIQRAKRFLPIHGALLRTLASEWTYPVLKANNNPSEHDKDDTKLAMDETFWKLLDRFLAERAALLSLKSTHQTKYEPIQALLQPRGPYSIQNIGQTTGISAPILSSIVNIFMSHIHSSTTEIKSKGSPFLALLEMVGLELRKMSYDLERLIQSKPSSNTLTNAEYASSSIEPLEPIEIMPQVNPSQTMTSRIPQFDFAQEFENAVEQRKLAILLTSNLHRSIAAAIL